MRKITFGLLLVVLVFMVGCAKPPEQAIAAATAAIADASAAGAGEYAGDSLKAAEDAKAKLDAEIKAQADKFALFRSYKVAEQLANETKAAGEKAKADAIAQKEKVKQEATALIAENKTALTEATELLAKAPKGKGTKEDLKMLEADLAGAGQTIADAEAALGAERFNEAKAKAEGAKAKIAEVKAAVEAAIAAKGGKKK